MGDCLQPGKPFRCLNHSLSSHWSYCVFATFGWSRAS